MKHIAVALIPFSKFSESALVTYANKHRLAIAVAPGLTNFPDVIYNAAALATLISDYRLSLGLAYKGSKTQTANKDSAKLALITALRLNCGVVNVQAQANSGNFNNYASFKAYIATSGFDVQDNNTRPGPLAPPMIRSLTSPSIGELKVILNKFSKSGKQRTKEIPGVNAYEISYRTSAVGITPSGPWLVQISTAYFSTITGLASGSYDIQVRARGSNSYSSVTSIRSVVVL